MKITKIIILFIIILFLIFYINEFNLHKMHKPSEQFDREINEKQIENYTLKLSISNLDTLNPLESKNKDVFNVSKLIFIPLIEIDERQIPNGIIAESWSQIDEKIFIIKLNKDFYFSNGEKITAKDVEYTIELIKKYENSIYKELVNNIEKIEIIDDYNIKIYQNKNDNFIEYKFNFPIICKTEYEKNNNIIGAGKYKIYKKEENRILLEKNNLYYKEDNNISKVEIYLFKDLMYVYNAFKNNKLNLVNLYSDDWKSQIGNVGYSYIEYIGRNFELLVFNCENKKLADKNIRKSIAYSINKDEINKEVYNNNRYIAEFLLSPNSWLNSNKINTNIKSNITSKIYLNLIVEEDKENRCKIAENIKKQLKEKDIYINIEKLSKEKYINRINDKIFDIALMGIDMDLSPDLSIFLGEKNYASYKNNDILNLLKKNENKEETFKKINEIFNEDVPYLPLFFEKNIVAYKNIYGIINPTWNKLF